MTTDIQARSNVSLNIQRLLEDRDWSVRELSRRTGDPVTTLYGIVRGENIPGAGVLSRIAEAFDVSMDRLVGPPPTPPEPTPNEIP